jgi:Fe-S cluster biosynthesis and repair protein YggX
LFRHILAYDQGMSNVNVQQRISQWEQMAREAPDDMAFFSLGSAYKDAERLEEAAEAFSKALELNPKMSRAYQLYGQVLIQLGRQEQAAEVLTSGYTVAAERGDVMPQKAMGSLLEKLGLPVPTVAGAGAAAAPLEAGADTVMDRHSGTLQQRLDGPPMRGPMGRFIYDHFGQETWRQWIGMGTKVINELRLDFSNEQHQATYEQHMLEWLGVTAEEIQQYAEQTGRA